MSREGWGRDEWEGREGEGMVGSEGGGDAYRIEDKTTTTTLLSSSSSLVSLRRVHAPPRPLSHSWRWRRGCAYRCRPWC